MKIITVTLNPCIDKTVEIKNFSYGGLNRVSSVRQDVGGKGINVSKVLSRFGAGSVATGILAGEQGRYIEEYLGSKGIDSRFVYAEGEVRTNLKVVNLTDSVTTEINEPGINVSENTVNAFFTGLEKLLPESDIIVLSGSIPKGVDASVYREIIMLAKQFGVKSILDADGEALREGLCAEPYGFKPNLFELQQLTGEVLDTPQRIISAVRKLNVPLTAVSMGADGAMFISDERVYVTAPFPIKCRSTVGAGDSMVAAIAYGLHNDFDIEKTARLATAAGTLTASKPGSEVCSLAEVAGRCMDVELTVL